MEKAEFSIYHIIEKKAQEVLTRLQNSFRTKDLVATGETVNSLRFEMVKDGFKIWGADWIEFSEYGRGKSKNSSNGEFLKRLYLWAAARGFPEAKVEILKYRINKIGTNLFRGQDKRFVGKKSGVLTDVLNEDLEKELQVAITIGVLSEFKKYIRKSYE
jgi:hypothetical protein